jgi:hypothetical protein
MKKEYVLPFPERWKILITKENFDIVTPYYSKVSSTYTSPLDALNEYIGSHDNRNRQPFEVGASASFFKSEKEYEYTTITTEQFVEYVLNQKVNLKPENHNSLIHLIKNLDNGN